MSKATFPKTKPRLDHELRLLAQGTMGHCHVDFEEGEDNPLGLLATMGLDDWFRWIAAIEVVFGDLVTTSAFELYNLHEYETVSQATDLLWRLRREDL